MIINIVNQYRKDSVPRMRKRNLHGWIMHIKHKTLRQTKRESSYENREYYKRALNTFTREARRTKEMSEKNTAEKNKTLSKIILFG